MASRTFGMDAVVGHQRGGSSRRFLRQGVKGNLKGGLQQVSSIGGWLAGIFKVEVTRTWNRGFWGLTVPDPGAAPQ